MTWIDNNFPRADDPSTVRWIIGYWRIEKAPGVGPKSYRLKSVIFDHLDNTYNQAQAEAYFQKYVDAKKATGKVKGIKALNLFLLHVNQWEQISGNDGEVIE